MLGHSVSNTNACIMVGQKKEVYEWIALHGKARY
jgi:hypothetical protein